MSVCEGFWNCISPDAWVTSIGTLIGALLGALIAGCISILILKSDRKKQEKTEIENKYNELMKFQEKYKRCICPIMGNLGLIEQHLENKEYGEISHLIDINFSNMENIRSIKTLNLDHASLIKVNDINRNIEFILFQLLIMNKTSEQIREGNLPSFYENLNSLRKSVDILSQHESELKKSIN